MKKFLVTIFLLAAAGSLFAQDLAAPETEDDAIALIAKQATMLKLGWWDRLAATNAFKEMVKAGVSVENAWRMVSAALEKGLKSKEMTKLKEQVRLSVRQKLSVTDCEESLRLMIQDQIRLREQLALETQTKTQTKTQSQTQTSAPAAAAGGKGK